MIAHLRAEMPELVLNVDSLDRLKFYEEVFKLN